MIDEYAKEEFTFQNFYFHIVYLAHFMRTNRRTLLARPKRRPRD